MFKIEGLRQKLNMSTQRKVLFAKIHGATVTEANLHYEGSITIPPQLLEITGIKEYEAVWVWNITSGTRFETYVIEGPKDSNDICVNGAAAHLANPKDKVIIAAFANIPENQMSSHKPIALFTDENNQPIETRKEQANKTY